MPLDDPQTTTKLPPNAGRDLPNLLRRRFTRRTRRSILFGSGLLLVGMVVHSVAVHQVLGQLFVFVGAGWLARDTTLTLLTADSSATTPEASPKVPDAPQDSSTHPDSPSTDIETTASIETQIVTLLEENDGRLPQTEIVASIDRSKATVSKYLSRLADDDEIVKVPRGRENLVCRPDSVPEPYQQ